MSFEYVEEELSLKFKGTEHKFRQPNLKEGRTFSKECKEDLKDGEDIFDVYIRFFENLGVPREVLEQMNSKGLMDLLAYTTGAKKN